MGKLVYIMGKSGTGKSRSMKDIPANRFALINPEGKDLPFGKTAPAFRVERVCTDKADEIVMRIKSYAQKYKIVVVDDFQTVMTNEYMRRSAEVGYQKWTDIGKHAWEIAEAAKQLSDDVIVYIMCHTEQDENGNEKIKTLGKLLDQNVVLESKSTIVLKTACEDGKYYFVTQNNGKDTVKSPEGMFPSYAIPNDLKYVDDKIRNYYDMDGAKTDEEIAEADAANKQEDVQKSGSRRGRTKTAAEVRASNKEKMNDYMDKVSEAVEQAADGREAVPFEEVAPVIESIPKPEQEPIPRRSRKNRAVVPQGGVCEKDTFFYIEATDNYVKKHKGDPIPEGAKEITEAEFGEGIKRIAQESTPEPAVTSGRRRPRKA